MYGKYPKIDVEFCVPAVASAAAPALADDAQSAAVSANDAATSDVDVEV